MKIRLLLMSFFLGGCNQLFYYPDRLRYSDPQRAGVELREKNFAVDGGQTLHAWYFPARKPGPCDGQVLVHFHGNAQNLSSHFAQLFWVTDHGMNYLIFDYPGYGQSTGEADRDGIHRAAVGFLRTLAQTPDPDLSGKTLTLYGQSLGGAVLLASLAQASPQKKVKQVIIESSFASYRRIARRKLSETWLTWPFQWLAYLLISDRHSVLQELEAKPELPPVLVVHGEADRIVPFIEGEELYSRLEGPKDFWRIPGVGHLQVLDPRTGVRERLLQKLCASTSK